MTLLRPNCEPHRGVYLAAHAVGALRVATMMRQNDVSIDRDARSHLIRDVLIGLRASHGADGDPLGNGGHTQ
jgi:hypothetical protein